MNEDSKEINYVDLTGTEEIEREYAFSLKTLKTIFKRSK